MRKFLILGTLLFMSVMLCHAQPGAGQSYNGPYLVLSSVDTASDVDYSNSFILGGAKLASIRFKFIDRFSVASVHFQYRAAGASTWISAATADSIAAFASTSDGHTRRYEYMIRDGLRNFCPTIDGQCRFYVTFAGSGCDGKAYTVHLITSN